MRFNEWSRSRLWAGCKWATARRTRKADPGDRFAVEWRPVDLGSVAAVVRRVYEVVEVVEGVEVREVVGEWWREEGAFSPGELRAVLRDCYPGLQEGEELVIHRFRLVEDRAEVERGPATGDR